MNTLVNDFMAVTGTNRSMATKYLKDNNNHLQDAINDYLNRKQDPKLIKVFEKYCESDMSTIEVNGTMNYLEDLGIEPEDIRSLILSYFLDSSSMGVFQREKFLNNWNKEKINNITDMKTFIDKLHDQYKDLERFQEIYEFVFGFLLEQPNQKLINYEIIIDYWKLMFEFLELPDKVNARISQWYEFIESQGKHLNRDTYVMWYEFVKEVIMEDAEGLGGYDEMSSWPSMVDEYVEYLAIDQ
ncbi:defective in cullin neddylation protein 1 [[Candida] jaroonii]|uniref:Defective in cullin neddylation protein 1 n=1 Tax=[Candida] jaroonii TaxID=467808 RepID=A0ACA9YFR5_9ASCO|nr:defective in cullin neddylation protein 1 [[Candida] jaroonii]